MARTVPAILPGRRSGTLIAALPPMDPDILAHDPEKWIPVFGKDHAPRISWSEMMIRRKIISLWRADFPFQGRYSVRNPLEALGKAQPCDCPASFRARKPGEGLRYGGELDWI